MHPQTPHKQNDAGLLFGAVLFVLIVGLLSGLRQLL